MSTRKKRIREETELEEIRKGFEMFDVNGTGKIIPLEVKEAMDSMNMKEKNPFIYEVIECLCSEKEYRNNDGISIEDLVNYVYDKVNDNETNMGLRQLFDALKDPESDTISMSTFIRLAKDYGDDEGISEDELRHLLEKTQLGGDELTFEEFYTIMKGGGNSSSKSDVSMRSYEASNKKRESPFSNINSQEMINSKKDYENDNVNYNEEELNMDNMKSPEKSVSMIKNNNNNNIELDSFEKGFNQIKIESQETPEKKEENITIEKNIIIEKKEDQPNNIVDKKEEKVKTEINVEKKEEKPIRKYQYNRFRRFDNNNNNAQKKDNKVVVEEKAIAAKNVYRIRRPVNLNNNEDKKEDKKINEDQKEEAVPKRYHRRYRENKMSTNIGQ